MHPEQLRIRAVAAVVLCMLAAGVTRAMFVHLDVDNVPVSRLVANLEHLLKERPNDANLHLNLARTHAMAWAQRTETVDVTKGKDEWGPQFGNAAEAVPFTMTPTTDPARLKAAEPHLKAALNQYAEAIRLDPANVTARLGQAWLIHQSGDKVRAIPLYRQVIELAWPEESRQLPIGTPIVEETCRYLIPLLDPERDRAEIQQLKTRLDQLSRMPGPITPIAIPLADGLDAQDLVAPHARVPFDADGSGLRRTWSWITPSAGWLVYNQRSDPAVTSALQLFGNVTFWLFWQNGYDALAALDDNADGALRGAELAHMAIWRDANMDGHSDPGEVMPLSAWGIIALSTRHELSEDGIVAAWSPSGVVFANGHQRPTWDLLLYRTR